MTQILSPGAVTLAQLETLWRGTEAIALNPSARSGIGASANLVAQAAKGDTPVYGVNTGFGKLASVRIAPKDTETLQRNLILSHCCGVGEALEAATVRLMMALKLLSLGRGASGVRWEICALLEAMLDRGVLPVIPVQGSVGASGDLAPLAHMAAVMMGHAEAVYDGQTLPGGVLREHIREEMYERLTGEHAPYNLKFVTNGVSCTTVSVITAARPDSWKKASEMCC